MKITDDMIDPQLRLIGKLFRMFSGPPRTEDFRKNQAMMIRLARFMPAGGMKRESVFIPRSHSDSQLRLSIMKSPEPQANVPGLLWLHGGGYAIGVPEMAGTSMPKKLMDHSPCVIVAPDYRVSVDAPYPAALEDAYDALVWMKDHAAELGINSNHLIVGGESAGGGLAVALCMVARDRNEVAISFQIPLYPMLDDRMETDSQKENDAPVWNYALNRVAWQMYLGDLFGKHDVPPYAAPARAVNYSALPPAVSFVGTLEPFRDETIAYFDNLSKAGVPADLQVFEGCYHGFDIMNARAKVSREATAFVLEKYRYALDHYSAAQSK